MPKINSVTVKSVKSLANPVFKPSLENEISRTIKLDAQVNVDVAFSKLEQSLGVKYKLNIYLFKKDKNQNLAYFFPDLSQVLNANLINEVDGNYLAKTARPIRICAEANPKKVAFNFELDLDDSESNRKLELMTLATCLPVEENKMRWSPVGKVHLATKWSSIGTNRLAFT